MNIKTRSRVTNTNNPYNQAPANLNITWGFRSLFSESPFRSAQHPCSTSHRWSDHPASLGVVAQCTGRHRYSLWFISACFPTRFSSESLHALTSDILSVGVVETRLAVTVTGDPRVAAVERLALVQALDVGFKVRAMKSSASEPLLPQVEGLCKGVTYFSTAPLFQFDCGWPLKRLQHTRIIPQFCLNIPKLDASSCLLSP